MLLPAGLIALAALTKCSGTCLIPLLAVSEPDWQTPISAMGCSMLIPLAALGAYGWVNRALYGDALLCEATEYAKYAKGFFGVSGDHRRVDRVDLRRWVSGRRDILCASAVANTIAGRICRRNGSAGDGKFLGWITVGKHGAIQTVSQLSVKLQILFWTIGGLGVLVLTAADIWSRRDARSGFLVLWVLGTFLFAAFFNWTVNGRSLLPLAPAVGILLARRLEQNILTGRKTCLCSAAICLAAGAALALLVTQADFCLATAVRQSARQACAKYGRRAGNLVVPGTLGISILHGRDGRAAAGHTDIRVEIRRYPCRAGEQHQPVPGKFRDGDLEGDDCRFRPALADDVEHTGGRRFFCGSRGAVAVRLWPCAAGKRFRLCLEVTGSGFHPKS